MKKYSIAALLALTLILVSIPGWTQQSSGQAGKSMMGGSEGSMMQNDIPMGQGRMMPDMMDMMNRMSGMMDRMSNMMKSMPANDMQDMSALMRRMSRQMDEMTKAMESSRISENHMGTMHENMVHMQNSLSEMEKK